MPFSSATGLSCIWISETKEVEHLIDLMNRTNDFCSLHPIYEEVREIALKKGDEYLLEKFDEIVISDVLDINRENIGLKKITSTFSSHSFR